jgi:hypothetical protein
MICQSRTYITAYKKYKIDQDINWVPLAFCARCCACKKYKDDKGRQLGAPYFFLRGVTHVKTYDMVRDINRESHAFYMRCYVCKKYKRWLGMSIETPG